MSVPKLYKIPHERDGLKLPPHGSQELLYYITWLRTEDNQLLFEKAYKNIPNSDVDYLLNVTKEPSTQQERTKLSQMLAFNRLANRICENCGDKKDITKLSICNDCGLAWYCSKECQTNHWDIHKLRCCKPDGPLDEGYQAIALLRRK